MTGNQTVMVFKIGSASPMSSAQYNLMYKTFTRMMKIKIYTATPLVQGRLFELV